MWGGVYIFKTAQIIVKFLLDLMKFLKFLNKKWLYIMLEDHKKLFKKQLKKIFSKQIKIFSNKNTKDYQKIFINMIKNLQDLKIQCTSKMNKNISKIMIYE